MSTASPSSAGQSARKFDYIVVGSGAGGGPLAARLALAGKRVLVVEAGEDVSARAPTDGAREVSEVPVLSGAASEHPDLAWEFFVKHYGNTPPPPVGADPKWQVGPTAEKTGIFYPRSSGLGGCTVHNAMITIAGPDSDWDDLADFLRDDSWRSERMRPYFQRLEQNQYLPEPGPQPRSRWVRKWNLFRWLIGYEKDYTGGRHGFAGWLRTSVADITLGIKDLRLIIMLKGAFKDAEHSGLNSLHTLLRRFLHGTANVALDPNHAKTQKDHPEGLALIPIAVNAENGPNLPNGDPSIHRQGHRSSPREFLLEVRAQKPENLVIETNCFVTQVLFAPGDEPRATGVEYLRGRKLYHAHISSNPDVPAQREKFELADGGEVILCGGSFNTPQMLMLSGIGPRGELARHGIACRVDSPGVGTNLQDRYEVGIVSEMTGDFSLLDGASLKLPDPPNNPDRFMNQWRQQGTGLYTSNGAVLGIFKRSCPEAPQPDLFIFGLPFAFRGYAPGYSMNLAHNMFTWAILKAHTNNHNGTVKLRGPDPLQTPEIDFNYFPAADNDPDLQAVVEGVKFVRGIGQRATWVIKDESYPGTSAVPQDEGKIRDWIRQAAWGHHACGTCRMGTPEDANAVLDSQFRVFGGTDGSGRRSVVKGLRVVDASIFPKIPGVFIVTNIYMASEKAADVILAEATECRTGAAAADGTYPEALRRLEAAAIQRRRELVKPVPGSDAPEAAHPPGTETPWASDVAGLAISGGGVRSATIGLGILQGLAGRNLLRRIDFLSTVSGGGYIGSFLGRCFDRERDDADNLGIPGKLGQVPDRVEREITAPHSRTIHWLRKHANFIAPNGPGDTRLDLAVFLRNIFSVHFVIGLLLFSLFGLANLVRYGLFGRWQVLQGTVIPPVSLPIEHLISAGLGAFWSPWFQAFELVLLFLVFPKIVGYWLASEDEAEAFEPVTLSLVFVVAAVLFYLGLRDGLHWEPIALGASVLCGFPAVVLAWRRGRIQEAAVGSGGAQAQRVRTRVYLTEDLGVSLGLAGLAGAFFLIDTAGFALQQYVAHNSTYTAAIARIGALILALVPVVRGLAVFVSQPPKPGTPPSTLGRLLRMEFTAGAMAVVLMAVPLVSYSFLAHAAFNGGSALTVGLGATALAIILTLILAGHGALPFVNRSSLSQTYTARLVSTYLGASNPLRHRASGADVTEAIPGDDVPSLENYRPHLAGGPFHIINTTINQTVDFSSRRGNRDRKGEILAVSCLGMTIGKYWHSLFPGPAAEAGVVPTQRLGASPSVTPAQGPAEGDATRTPLIPVGYIPGTDHPLIDDTGESADDAEVLSLGKWFGISGAAIGPARGQNTTLGYALLFGLANLRTGYWWDSGIDDSARADFPRLGFVRRLLYLLPRCFVPQSLILSEWLARFQGPWERNWQLSDGGYFENTGAYELIRRRIPRIVIIDSCEDPEYLFSNIADLTRKARIDFQAEISPIDQSGFDALDHSAKAQLGRSLADLKPVIGADGSFTSFSAKHGVLFVVTYADGRKSLLLYLKASLTGDEATDVLNYHALHQEFPHEATEDQFFNEPQWESYRKLGAHIAGDLAWFWKSPIPPA